MRRLCSWREGGTPRACGAYAHRVWPVRPSRAATVPRARGDYAQRAVGREASASARWLYPLGCSFRPSPFLSVIPCCGLSSICLSGALSALLVAVGRCRRRCVPCQSQSALEGALNALVVPRFFVGFCTSLLGLVAWLVGVGFARRQAPHCGWRSELLLSLSIGLAMGAQHRPVP